MVRNMRTIRLLYDICGAPAGHPPNRPDQPRRSPCNVPTTSWVAFNGQMCYRFEPVGEAMWGISH